MGATNEDAHALSTAATKPSAMTALPRLNKAATLPFELVLNIMDHAILEAESDDSLELDWYIYDNDMQALGIDFGYAEPDMKLLDALQHRYTGIRTLLQTNRKIRSMVLGKFYFLYPPPLGETDFFYYILINPKKDLFEIDGQSKIPHWLNWKSDPATGAFMQDYFRILQSGQKATGLPFLPYGSHSKKEASASYVC
ncbi:hypothetical protein CNYM01_11218 [Colletotrichum nymphaeae SA-01]|uniref:Uncharacterized protein n=1 Tax=Colletotrichum nymphaeae SA-01 TaxID=1460502 RepID=A0A135U8T3_9PEZI|nr:hypothetical protein CNYM01_11218 [Colletotrichum nymphaeae SA-01]